jgi:NAD(P)-dependent dehydrogenase (short-subunit alcohol dehydrogenase family)
MSNERVVLVTGASSGVGKATAHLLSRHGLTVFGTSRNPASMDRVAGVEMLALDVCSDDSVRSCVDEVVGKTGRIDVLINNAGYELAGALEELTLDEARAQFETNFFGVVRMVNAVLPLMRQQRRGRIINVGSLSGLTAAPFLGIYSASKCALEGYTEALRYEVKPFDVHVSLTQAGFLKTPMMHRRQAGAHQIADYSPWRERALEAIGAAEQKGPGPDVVAAALLRIATSPAPRLRYLVGRQAKTVAQLRKFLPVRLFELGARRSFALDRTQ